MTYPTALDYFVFISFAYIFSTVVQVFPFFFGLFVHISNQRNNKSQQLKLETFSNNLKRNHPSVWAGASLHQAGQWGILSGRTGAWGNWIGTGYLPSTTWYYEGSVNKEISKMTGKPFSTLIPPRCVQGDSEGWAKEEEEEEERRPPPWWGGAANGQHPPSPIPSRWKWILNDGNKCDEPFVLADKPSESRRVTGLL